MSDYLSGVLARLCICRASKVSRSILVAFFGSRLLGKVCRAQLLCRCKHSGMSKSAKMSAPFRSPSTVRYIFCMLFCECHASPKPVATIPAARALCNADVARYSYEQEFAQGLHDTVRLAQDLSAVLPLFSFCLSVAV